MEVYTIIGGTSTRKSALIRSLTGCASRSIRDIQLQNSKHIRVYVLASALQAEHMSQTFIMNEAKHAKCDAILFALWPHANPANPIKYPDALTYLNDLMIEGWNIKKVIVLGKIKENIYYQFSVKSISDVEVTPINYSASIIRNHFEWV